MSAHNVENYLGTEPGTNLHRALKEACIAWVMQFGETTGKQPDPKTMGIIVGAFSHELQDVLTASHAEQGELAAANYRAGYQLGYATGVDPSFLHDLRAIGAQP